VLHRILDKLMQYYELSDHNLGKKPYLTFFLIYLKYFKKQIFNFITEKD